MYAAGKIPGGFPKREGRPTENAILAARLTDRPIRPLFPKGYRAEVQVMTTVLSADQENDPDILSVIGASSALTNSPIPFEGPVGAVRMGLIDGEFIVNPTFQQLATSAHGHGGRRNRRRDHDGRGAGEAGFGRPDGAGDRDRPREHPADCRTAA